MTPEEIAKADKREAEEAEYQKKRNEQSRVDAIATRRKHSGIPIRLQGKLETALQTAASHGWSKTLANLQGKLGSGFLYSLTGTYGVGKSQLGASMAWQACETVHALFIHAPELFDTIKDVFRGDDGDTVREQLSKFIKPKLLVIDEVNSGLTEADIRYLHRVVCQRYDDMTDTLLISNESKTDFQKLVGDRVVSRMVECGGIIEADWPSFRR